MSATADEIIDELNAGIIISGKAAYIDREEGRLILAQLAEDQRILHWLLTTTKENPIGCYGHPVILRYSYDHYGLQGEPEHLDTRQKILKAMKSNKLRDLQLEAKRAAIAALHPGVTTGPYQSDTFFWRPDGAALVVLDPLNDIEFIRLIERRLDPTQWVAYVRRLGGTKKMLVAPAADCADALIAILELDLG